MAKRSNALVFCIKSWRRSTVRNHVLALTFVAAYDLRVLADDHMRYGPKRRSSWQDEMEDVKTRHPSQERKGGSGEGWSGNLDSKEE